MFYMSGLVVSIEAFSEPGPLVREPLVAFLVSAQQTTNRSTYVY